MARAGSFKEELQLLRPTSREQLAAPVLLESPQLPEEERRQLCCLNDGKAGKGEFQRYGALAPCRFKEARLGPPSSFKGSLLPVLPNESRQES